VEHGGGSPCRGRLGTTNRSLGEAAAPVPALPAGASLVEGGGWIPSTDALQFAAFPPGVPRRRRCAHPPNERLWTRCPPRPGRNAARRLTPSASVIPFALTRRLRHVSRESDSETPPQSERCGRRFTKWEFVSGSITEISPVRPTSPTGVASGRCSCTAASGTDIRVARGRRHRSATVRFGKLSLLPTEPATAE